MKVLHIFNELKFSGAEIMYVDSAPIFQKLGCQLTAMSTAENVGEFGKQFSAAGYDILHIPYPKIKKYWKRIFYFYTFTKFLKKNQFDIVHIHRSGAMWGFSLCAWLAGKKSVYTFHSVFPTRKISFPYHFLLRWSAKHIFNCKFQTISNSVYKNELVTFKNETTKIYNWYGSQRFYPTEQNEKEKIRKELGIESNTLVLISIGGCSPVKRHSEVIKALPKILQYEKNCLYLHLGEGCLEDEEKTLAKELGVINHIRFYGNQLDVRKYLIASDIYLMTSKFEGISLTTIEALACKIPAILYDVPGLRDFNVEKENSLLVPENYEILAEKILFLKNDPAKREKLIKNGKEFVEANFALQKNAEQIFQLYIN